MPILMDVDSDGSVMAELIQSPLVGVHTALGAKFAAFGGWSMPVEYAGVLAEHKAVREQVGVFDVSHLGTFLVEGEGAAAYLNTRLTNDIDRISDGKAQYTLLLNDHAGAVDDMILYLFSANKVMVIPNAANAQKVMSQLSSGSPSHLRFTDRHHDDAIIAVQGPASEDVLARMGLPSQMEYMSFLVAELESGISMTLCRTGYTGEHGYEIVVPAHHAPVLWAEVMAAGADLGIQPCGLGARDTLRTEMGYALHGHELSETISPVEARLGWAVGWKKDHFDGDEVLRAQRENGAERASWGIKACGRAIPRPEMVVVDALGAPIGQVTSGTFSPSLKQGIGLALLPPSLTPGDHVFVEVRGRHEEFEVVKPPFYTSNVA